MGIGKLLAYTAGGAILGVGAVAAAPFTGGGSILGAISLGASLAGAGTVAAGTATVLGGAGAYMARRDDEEDDEKDAKIAALNQKAQKFEENFKKALEQFHGDKEYFNFIIGATAIGIAIAYADGEMSEEEKQEIEEFIGGIASSNYPVHIKQIINDLYESKPSLLTAMAYMEKIDPKHYNNIRDLLVLIMLADGFEHDKEIAFIAAYDANVTMISYKPEAEDSATTFLDGVRKKSSVDLDRSCQLKVEIR